jgi:proline racemase
MYGAILTESEEKGVDLDCFFINTDGYSPMCGHAILAIAKVVLETGLVKREQEEINIAVPAGIVHARAVVGGNGEVKKSSFKNVPSFAYLLDQHVSPGIEGGVKFDVAFGGAFYAFVDADVLKLDLTSENYRTLIDSGRRIKKAIVESVTFEHPFESDLSDLLESSSLERPMILRITVATSTSLTTERLIGLQLALGLVLELLCILRRVNWQ